MLPSREKIDLSVLDAAKTELPWLQACQYDRSITSAAARKRMIIADAGRGRAEYNIVPQLIADMDGQRVTV